jgi:hypothetical protein
VVKKDIISGLEQRQGGKNGVKPGAETVTVTVTMDNQWRPKPLKNAGRTRVHVLYTAVKRDRYLAVHRYDHLEMIY